jgi:hypothetical protein|tara:strand:+ start:726 stop:1139 length:414 start_codon:yes stop_codon:yes gene_type:complete
MRKVIDLENVSSNWKISGHIPNNNDGRARSKYHLKARSLLRQAFPTCQILEEVPIRVRRAETLYLDFFVPLHDLCVEVHGEQHYKFVRFYHKTKLGFAQARKRDKKKVEWCELNNISVIELPFNEDENGWKKRIENR